MYNEIDKLLFMKVEEISEQLIKEIKTYGKILEYINECRERAFEENNLLLAEFYDNVEDEVKLKAKYLKFE